MDAAAPAAIAQATQSALAGIRKSFDALGTSLTNDVQAALKKAFTDAIVRVYFWGLFVILLGFIVTLFMPELALRKTAGNAPAMAPAEGAAGSDNGQGKPAPIAAPAPEPET
jgi:hypothetical protein